jgi:hypothetical protein
MSSQEAVHDSPATVTPELSKGTLDTWRVPSAAWWSDTEPALSQRMWWDEAVGKPRRKGVYANQRFSVTEGGKVYGRKAKVSNRTGEIPPSGIIGGPRET